MKNPFKRALAHFSNKVQYVYPIVFLMVKMNDALRITEISVEVKKWYETVRIDRNPLKDSSFSMT